MVSANEMNDINITSTSVESPLEITDSIEDIDDSNLDETNVLQVSSQDSLQSRDEVIVVNNWDELQYYCSLSGKDYTLKLKENTNFYPSEPINHNHQIIINNNVKIIGSDGAYFGDVCKRDAYIEDGHYVVDGADPITYASIIVPDNNHKSLSLENVTFKWIYTLYSPDGVFLQMGGNARNIIKNCVFENINTMKGHSCIVYLKKGDALLENCSFINCTTDFGCVSLYDPKSYNSARMTVKDCYFENNFARTEPGCINNCAILTVYNTTFYKNRASNWAGAIHTHFFASATIYDSTFIDNVAGWNGGALYTYSDLKIYNTSFIGNNCTTNNGGGAIGACKHVSAPHVYIENSYFEKNENLCWDLDELSTTGTGCGGAISLMDEGSLEVRNSIFVANAAANGVAINARTGGPVYGSPDVIIVNNAFINHTRAGDALMINLDDTLCNISDNYYLGNSIVFSNLTLTTLNVDKDQSTLQITASLTHPSYYDSDILDKTLYDVYVNDKYVKTVNSTIFTLDFGDFDICDVYVIPTISNRKSNVITLVSTREYIFVSKLGNDNNNGNSRNNPVKSVKKALELAKNCQNIIILDGEYSESLGINYDVTLKGEGDVAFTDKMSFNVIDANFTLKNININNLNSKYFISQQNNNLIIDNCIFENNVVSPLIEANSVKITNSIIKNNKALIINTTGFATITNSILLNNTDLISQNADYNLDYNWWGNIIENYKTTPFNKVNNWLVLNATSNVNCLEVNHVALINFTFNLFENNTVSKYASLRNIVLFITPINGTSVNSTFSNSKIEYTLTSLNNGKLIAEYNNIKTALNFEFVRTNPNINVQTENIMVGDDLIINVNLPKDATGNLTVNVVDACQNKIINTNNLVFTFKNIKANEYIVNVIYSGDDKYLSKEINTSMTVFKYDSTTNLDIGVVNVGEDVVLTITTLNDATGNINLKINNHTETLILNNSKTNYTIKKITRGDYIIAATYNGDEKYLPSDDSKFIEVDNLNATLNVVIMDIVYGETALIQLTINDDATGNVSVSVDAITNTSIVQNGKANIELKNLEAGLKETIIFYTGDNTYFNKTFKTNFTINKANLAFNISSNDIKIGQDAIIHIKVPAKTSGTFTINDDVIKIPLSGIVEYLISDLEIGEYVITAVYNGNNYYTVSNSTSFKVLEYPIPQWQNDGFNSENTCQSPYESNTNGEIQWISLINEEIVGNLVIDSEGNVYVATSSKVYSFDNDGNLRWNFTSESLEGNFSGLCIGRDVIVVPSAGDTLYFINQTDGFKYGSSNLYQGSSLFAPTIDSNANLYIASEYQHDSNSYKLVKIPYKSWEYGGEIKYVDLGKTQPLSSPVVNDDIIVVLSESRLGVVDAKTLQSKFIKSGDYASIKPIIGEGNIIYAVLGKYIVAYSSAGAQLWKTKVTGGVGKELVLDSENGLYSINSKGNLYKYDLITGKESLVSNLLITSGILVGNNGNLYLASNNEFYELNPSGDVLWKSILEYNITGSPVMDKNGSIYITTKNGLVALTHAPLKDPNINISVNDAFVGNDVTVNVIINNQCIGDIKITIDGKTYTETINNQEIFTKTLSNLKAGTHNISVEFAGDLRFANATVYSNFTVYKYDSNLTVNTSDIFVGESLVFDISLASDATGTITLNLNNKNYTANKDNKIIIENLPAKNYNYNLVYSGDDKYEYKTLIGSVSVNKADTNLSVNVANINVGEGAIVNIKMSDNVEGNVTTIINSENYSAAVINGVSKISIPNLKADNYTISVYFTSYKYIDCVNTTSFSVTKVKLTGDALNVNGTVFTLNLPSDATGTFTVIVNDKNYTRNVVGGNAVVGISDLAPGNYTAHCSYSGDEKYENIVFDDVVLSIDKLPSNISVLVANIDVGDSAVVNITLSVFSGKLTITVNDKDYDGTVDNYVGQLIIPDLAVGNYAVIAKYLGDDTYNYSINTTTFSVLKVEVTIDNETIVISESADTTSYSINLPSDATGNFTVVVDGGNYTAELVNGKATVNIPELSVGSHNLTVIYSGDNKYSSIVKSVSVNKTAPQEVPVVKLTGSNLNMLYTSGKYYKVRLTSDGKALAGKNIKITINGKTYSRTTDNDGYASLKISLPPKTYNVKSTYNNVSITNKVVVKKIIQAKNINFKKSAKSLKIKVNLKKVNNKYLKGKKVTLKFKGKTYKVKTNKKGVATFTIKNNVLKKLKAGKKYTYKVTYLKEGVSKKITVKK